MTSALFSSSWYRVADLKPRLRRQARLVQHTYRGQRWYVMQDLASGRVLRFNPAAYRVLALMDGAMAFMHGACVALDGGISACLLDPD